MLCLHVGEEKELGWDERPEIAVHITHGIEYLHERVCLMLYFLLFYMKVSLVNMNMHGIGSPTRCSS